jgi:hypothetical protein
METKKQRFKRIAELRTSKIIESLISLSKLSNKNNYDYSEDEIRQIFKAIDQQLNATKLTFKNQDKNKIFKLK